MKVTFIIKNMTDMFYTGNGDTIIGIDNMTNEERFKYLNKQAQGDLKHNIKMKIGNDSFRDKVDLNMMLRNPCSYTYKIEPRKGYNLATFEIK